MCDLGKQIDQSKARAKRMLKKLLPFDDWLTMRPRTPEAIELYHLVASRIQDIADHGDPILVTVNKIVSDGSTNRK